MAGKAQELCDRFLRELDAASHSAEPKQGFEERRSWRERLAALESELEALPESQKPLDRPAASSKAIAVGVGRSAWELAVEIAQLRASRRSKGLNASVRVLATQTGFSRGRAGELLKMHDELSGRVAVFLGLGNLEEAARILSQLSYRQLRAVLAIPAASVMTRVRVIEQHTLAHSVGRLGDFRPVSDGQKRPSPQP